MISKHSKKFVRVLITIAICLLFYYLEERPLQSSGAEIQLFSSICQDDLRKTYLQAIQEAEKSIYLIMYSLTDNKIIQALNQKANEGIEITVLHDTSTVQTGYQKLKSINLIPVKMNGLMHQKILIIDEKNVWIGSANFTTESLRLHDNLVAKLESPELAQTIIENISHHRFIIGDQLVEFWMLPRDKVESYIRLIDLIDGATRSLRIAMYTWTHPEITEAIIRAYRRGVVVEIILDQGQAQGVGTKALHTLQHAEVPVWLSNGQKLLHHKCLWIDDQILVNGSTNWTKAAFTRNCDCFFILYDLSPEQREKLSRMWWRTRATSILTINLSSDILSAA